MGRPVHMLTTLQIAMTSFTPSAACNVQLCCTSSPHPSPANTGGAQPISPRSPVPGAPMLSRCYRLLRATLTGRERHVGMRVGCCVPRVVSHLPYREALHTLSSCRGHISNHRSLHRQVPDTALSGVATPAAAIRSALWIEFWPC